MPPPWPPKPPPVIPWPGNPPPMPGGVAPMNGNISLSFHPGCHWVRTLDTTPALRAPFDIVQLKRHAADSTTLETLRDAHCAMVYRHHLQRPAHRRVQAHA